MPFVLDHSAFLFTTYHYGKTKYIDRRSGALRHYFHYVVSGQGRVITPDATLEVRTGDLFYIPMGIPMESYWESSNGKQTVVASCGTTFFPEGDNAPYPIQKLPQQFVEDFLTIPLDVVPDSIALGKFFGFLGKISPAMARDDTPPNRTVLGKLQGYILKNPHCRVPDMAAHLGISVPTLYNLCKPLGKTPNTYKLETLLDWAVYMLRSSNTSVKALYEYVGFSSAAYFRKCLKAHTGLTPTQIRRARQAP